METKLTELTVAQLRQMCKDEGLAALGNKAELVKRLSIKKFGPSDTHEPARTKCKFCSAQVRVTGTHRDKMKDGRTMVTRQVRCAGRHRHSYPLKNIVGEKTKQPSINAV